MSTAIVLLSLGLAVAVATGSLADQAELVSNRNLAADRAERAAAVFIDGCGSTGCDSSTVDTTRPDGTVLTGCVNQTAGVPVLRVEARVPWRPRVFTGLTPAAGTVAVELGGFGLPATAVLGACR
ncbi:hypothetical protein [Candidatus Poriferisocius sp.]|uniref:hypothetical protein n=1 Tax=Candidatus Poriferisocius sp. TaxID=3101276 RepID=UPI003B01D001